MAKVLTEGSTVVCPHKGPIKFTASQHLLAVDKQAVLVTDDINNVTINCPIQTDLSKNLKKCSLLSLASGAATKLTVGNKPVLLETAKGATDGLPAGTWSVLSAGQTKLDAV